MNIQEQRSRVSLQAGSTKKIERSETQRKSEKESWQEGKEEKRVS